MRFYPPNRFYGVEYSPDSFYLYVTTAHVDASGNVLESHLWEMPPDIDDYGILFVNNSLEVVTTTEELGALQLAPNGNIYIAQNNSDYIGVIENPGFSVPGDFAIRQNAIFLDGAKSSLGLPNFTDITIVLETFVDGLCSQTPTDFQVTSNYDIVSQQWDFGDGVISDIPNPIHVYQFPGLYTVSVTVNTLVGSTTETFEIEIFETPNVEIPSDFVGCSLTPFVAFDLTEKIPELLNGLSEDEVTVSFHATAFDAEFDSFPLPELYTNQNLQETIYVQVVNNENPDCFALTQFDIQLELAPILNPVNNVVLCDEDSDGMVSLDLAQFNTEILNGQDNTIFEVLYFENESDAENNVNPIPTNYTNTNLVEEIFFRVSNRTSPECFELGSFTISVFSAAIIKLLPARRPVDLVPTSSRLKIRLSQSPHLRVPNLGS